MAIALLTSFVTIAAVVESATSVLMLTKLETPSSVLGPMDHTSPNGYTELRYLTTLLNNLFLRLPLFFISANNLHRSCPQQLII